MIGILLHLAGPMQSWGIAAAFNDRDTHRYPTRSGLLGLISAAHGHTRTTPLNEEWGELVLTVRIDRPGVRMSDFHTVGGGRRPEQTVPTSEGKRRSLDTATITSRRHYLADAAFTAALEGPAEVITGIAAALTHPVWAPYLGRRSCPAEAPLLLTPTPIERAAAELDHLPLARTAPRGKDKTTVSVEFVLEAPPGQQEACRSEELPDLPSSFHPHERAHHDRRVYLHTRDLPAALCGGYGTDYLTALHTYLESTTS
ncbi:type I-E CRISPR-associated protein Cas5/CasD [Crossiella sp. CA-258035]|uniref:type I-E CRISPR-associated protein Cas5/CasD n=1 Tax=Crossiella sp. CA-258035 TaxID=2981138 RepID=UPI0024BD49F7|nr:type I-E CRISPR-associated protein Cas5/CasD [Crossiella sp. CA-258035]WHT17410.1 type I-E CRISPR-associated protein Cas5/CasD [Crossiella sp. CA-258035]